MSWRKNPKGKDKNKARRIRRKAYELAQLNQAKALSDKSGYSVQCILDHKAPKPIGKGLSKRERIEVAGLHRKVGSHKIKALRSNYGTYKGQRGINEDVKEMGHLFKMFSNTPFRHLNLE